MTNIFESVLSQTSEKFNLNLQLKDFRAILTSEKFNRLHITADFIGDKNNFEMFVATIVGAGTGGTDFNKILFPKLLNSQENIRRLNEIYHGCIFQRFVRLNTFKTNLFFHIADLTSLNATGDFQKLQNYEYRFYHWLEYLRIGEFVHGENNSEAVLKRHIDGAQLFSNIQRSKKRRRD